MSFLRTMMLISSYGFLKEFKPTEPYLYEFEHVTLNISEQTLNADVYPIWTYSYLIALIPVFLLTDVLLYKIVIVAEGISYLACWIMFDFGKSVLTQQIIEGLYGAASATEIAYFAYVYVATDKVYYKRSTSLSRVALLAGRFSSYVVAQLIIGFHWGDYYTLNYISTGSLVLAVAAALLLPSISWKAAYARRFPVEIDRLSRTTEDECDTGSEDANSEPPMPSYKMFVNRGVRTMWRDGVAMYSQGFIFKWSLWWAVASCMDYQIENYTQTLWGSVQTDDTQYNGITEALVPILSLPVVLLMEKVNVQWKKWGEATLTVMSLIDAGLLLMLALTPSIFVMYGGYIAYRILYEAMITIAQYNLASQLVKDSFGLLFGLNTFIALSLQTLLTIAVESLLHLSIRTQFFVYTGCHVVVSLIFAGAALLTFFSSRRNARRVHNTHL